MVFFITRRTKTQRNRFYLWNRRWKNDLGGDAGRGGASSSKAVCLWGILSGTSRGLLAGGAGVPMADSEFLGEEGCACCFELLLLACLGLLGWLTGLLWAGVGCLDWTWCLLFPGVGCCLRLLGGGGACFCLEFCRFSVPVPACWAFRETELPFDMLPGVTAVTLAKSASFFPRAL